MEFDPFWGHCHLRCNSGLSLQCRQLDRVDYTHLLWTTLAEFPGIVLTVILVDKIGRRKTMLAELVLLCISLTFLYKCSLDRLFITVILFFIRGLASGVFQAAYVYTAEVGMKELKLEYSILVMDDGLF